MASSYTGEAGKKWHNVDSYCRWYNIYDSSYSIIKNEKCMFLHGGNNCIQCKFVHIAIKIKIYIYIYIC